MTRLQPRQVLLLGSLARVRFFVLSSFLVNCVSSSKCNRQELDI